MGIEVGHAFKAFLKKNPNAWGTLPLLAGAGDQFELNSESMKANVALIMNEGVYGRAFRRAGSAGNKTPGGDLDYDLYYRDAGLRALAAAIGSDTPSALGGGAHQHEMVLADSVDGIYFTLGVAGAEGIREWGHSKITGVKLRWDESTGRAKIMPNIAAFDENMNVGSPVDNFVVTSVTAANGPLTILAPALSPAKFNPSPLFITKDAGVTALSVAIVAVDRKGSVYTRTITQVDFTSNVFTDAEYVRSVVSITLSGVTGTGNIKVGVTNGINNATTAAALSTDSDRDCSLFSQLEVFITDQDQTTDFVAAQEQFLAAFEIGIQRNMDSRVTTQFGDRIEEPKSGGGGWGSVTCGINFSALTDRNRRFLTDRIGKTQLRLYAKLTGPPIASTGIAHSIEIWMNALQFLEGDANMASSGVLPFDLSAEAHQAVAVPFGFPAGADEPVLVRIKNGLSTGYLA